MSRPRIVITNRVYPETVDLLARHGEVVANDAAEPWTPDRLLAEIREASAVMAFMPDRVDTAVLDAAPRLGLVACALKGFDNFDVEACSSRGVWVSIVADLLTDPTAELTIALMIGLARNVLPGDRYVRTDFAGWRPRFYGAGLGGARVGILGMGAIGRAVGRRLAGFGCEIVYWDHQRLSPTEEEGLRARLLPMEELVSTSNFLVCALPLTPATRHLIDAEILQAMPRGALLVNPSRGSVVDEAAIAEALQAGHLGGYAADVFEMEDWALADRPRQIDPRLLVMTDRTLFTPHLGSAVADVRRAIERDAATNIVDFLEGRRPRGAINEVGVVREATALC